tara:strand:- start:47 stop:259 length:213 start_codon:yes stop_codon:yes gene_type:complete
MTWPKKQCESVKEDAFDFIRMMMKKCKECGEMYEWENPFQKFCSTDCYLIWGLTYLGPVGNPLYKGLEEG